MKLVHRCKAIILFLFLGVTFSAAGQTNEGVEFWFGFMQHRDNLQNSKVAMITSKQNTSGVISVPLRGWSQPFSVLANDVVIITLPSFTETTGSEFVEDNAIRIVSEQPVSVYAHQYFGFRSEATVVLPVSSLGMEYFVLTHTGFLRQTEHYPPEFLIVASRDNTTISINVTAETQNGKTAGTDFSINLDRGEVYQVRAKNWNGDLTGSYINADKPISVFAGASWAQVPIGCTAMDNLLEQMYPIQSLGSKFVTVPNANLTYDLYRILGTEDNTNIVVESTNTTNYNVDRGEFVQFNLSQASFIVADKPVLVAQFLIGSDCNGHSLGDPSMVMLNNVEQVRDTVTLFNSRFQNILENYINIIVRTNDAGNVQLDGQNLVDLGNVFLPVGSDGTFSYLSLAVDAGAHTIISNGCGVIATAYGYGELESYAYSGGASFSSINKNPIPEGGCLNDTVVFESKLDPNRYTFLWDLGDEIRTEPSFTKFYDALGTYPATLIINDICLNESDTFNRDIRITLRQAVTATDFVRTCEDGTFNLMATDLAEATYTWNGPNGFFSEDQFVELNGADTSQSGQYSVIGTISGCATLPAFSSVDVVPTPQPKLGSDSIICTKDEIDLILYPGEFNSYTWQDQSIFSSYMVNAGGAYHVVVEDEFGCVGMDSILLIEQCPTVLFVPNIFTPNGDSRNDFFGVLGSDIISMQLQVYDRWGALVFETKDVNEQWDGNLNGKQMELGVYVWTLSLEGYLENGETFAEVQSGNVTLLR